ncbi:hypothetical protein JYB87_11545 [Shewanella avicenniae]|uniref:Uncharacterized protein n=1 Tax=Shewanella avicenniae TaxID=2814294 RepID=A0ABX7QNC8_9GAMM|nr:hypothetical protein [Shewanella avicenniae]QSX32400.1 hypothetical protein JYB87_11545 [Shewanella avicenniae]
MLQEQLDAIQSVMDSRVKRIIKTTPWPLTIATFLVLMMGYAIWYLWCLAALEPLISAPEQDILPTYAPVHLALLTVMATLLLFISCLSTKAQALRYWQVLLVMFFGGGIIVAALPSVWAVLLLVVAAFVALAYFIWPWQHFIKPLQSIEKDPDILMFACVNCAKQIISLPHNEIRPQWLNLLQEILALRQTTPLKARFDEVVLDFSVHFALLFGALSFRLSSYGENEQQLLTTFLAQYPAFDSTKRMTYNQVAYYRNVTLNSAEAESYLRIMALKSGLIVADRSVKTLPDTINDLELLLLPLLLETPAAQQVDIIHLCERLMARLQKTQERLNVFQQNSWLEVLKNLALGADPVHISLCYQWYQLDQRYPQHRLSFAKETYAYNEAREHQLLDYCQRIIHQASLQLIDPHANNHSLSLSHLFEQINQYPNWAFAAFINQTPASLITAGAARIETQLATEFYAKLNALTEAHQRIEAPDREQPLALDATSDAAVEQQLSRYFNAIERELGLVLTQYEECDELRYCREQDRYEYDIEQQLDRAVLSRIDQCNDKLSQVLSELQHDIDTQHIDLTPFIAHLRLKFGALAQALAACDSNEQLQWLLNGDDLPALAVDSTRQRPQYLFAVMQQVTLFHQALHQSERGKAFRAISRLLQLFGARYPLNQETADSLIVSSIQMASDWTLPHIDIEAWLQQLQQLADDVLPLLTPERQQHVLQLIRMAFEKYAETSENSLEAKHKAQLQQLLLAGTVQ